MIVIRALREEDWHAIWAIMEPTFRSGETYPFPRDITEEEAYDAWVEKPDVTFVALSPENGIVGTYYLKPNQPALGDHIANCGYIVASHMTGQGIASQMCRHSMLEAKQRGFRAMQFNFVVSTNEPAVRLWQKLGFGTVGTVPEAFRHPRLGFVDVYIMHKELE